MNQESDMVKHPNHYQDRDGSGIESIMAIKAMLGLPGFIAFCKGTIARYNWRAGHKFNAIEDMAKIKMYTRFMMEAQEEYDKQLMQVYNQPREGGGGGGCDSSDGGDHDCTAGGCC